METSQELWFDTDVGLIYNNAKISANDENTALHIQNILNISNSDPSGTIIVIRDINREDEGFNWRKAMRILDEKGFTERIGYAGRQITETGLKELEKGLIYDQVDFVFSKFEDMNNVRSKSWQKQMEKLVTCSK